MTEGTRTALTIICSLTITAGLMATPRRRAKAAAGATINKPSVQVTLRTHRQFYRTPKGPPDSDTWAWSPRIKFRVNGPIPAGSQLSVEYTLPSGRPWIKHDCKTEETPAGKWWQTECGVNTADVADEQATIETGLAGFRVNLNNELAGTNSTLFNGKFKVEKFHVGSDLPKFKNNFSYYVNHDWNLPIGYVYGHDAMDYKSHPPPETEARLSVAFWFRGDGNTLNYSKPVAYLFHRGKQVADSTGDDGKYGNTDCEVENTASFESSYGYCRRKFTVNAMVFDKNPEYHPRDFPLYKNPGEYEVKVLQNGKLARVAKFTIGAGGNLVDTGTGARNNLGTGRIIIPAQIVGDQDGPWDKAAWRTEAFYGNPLAEFTAP